jgi:hypothetical protein
MITSAAEMITARSRATFVRWLLVFVVAMLLIYPLAYWTG